MLDKAADSRLKREYYVPGFTFGLKEYNKLIQFQGGGCAICGKKATKIRLAVDHCHCGPNAGLLRGLLCMRCNRGYGLWHDNNIERLLKTADYLVNPPFSKLYGNRFTAPGRIGTKKRKKLLERLRANGRLK